MLVYREGRQYEQSTHLPNGGFLIGVSGIMGQILQAFRLKDFLYSVMQYAKG